MKNNMGIIDDKKLLLNINYAAIFFHLVSALLSGYLLHYFYTSPSRDTPEMSTPQFSHSRIDTTADDTVTMSTPHNKESFRRDTINRRATPQPTDFF